MENQFTGHCCEDNLELCSYVRTWLEVFFSNLSKSSHTVVKLRDKDTHRIATILRLALRFYSPFHTVLHISIMGFSMPMILRVLNLDSLGNASSKVFRKILFAILEHIICLIFQQGRPPGYLHEQKGS